VLECSAYIFTHTKVYSSEMMRTPPAVNRGLNDVATPASNVATPDGGHQDLPSLQEFLRSGICDALKKAPEFSVAVVSAFDAEDVSSVKLLITMFGTPCQYGAFKTAV
jgi:hypothetical protein